MLNYPLAEFRLYQVSWFVRNFSSISLVDQNVWNCMLASRHFPSFGWYDDIPSPAEPTGVDQQEAWFDDTAVLVPSIAAAVFWIHRPTTPRYSVLSTSSIFRERNDLPTRAARNHTIWTGAPWWPLLGSRHTLWIVLKLHGNPVGWRTSIHFVWQHRMMLVDFQFPRDETGHSSKVGHHNPRSMLWSLQYWKRWDWTRMTLIVSGLSPISLFYQKSSSVWWIVNWRTSWNLTSSFPKSSPGSAPVIQSKPQCSRSCQTYILSAADGGRVLLLGLPDMSAAFGMVGHDILLLCSRRECPRASLLHSLLSRHITHYKGVHPQSSLLCRWRSAVFPRKGFIRGGELFCLHCRNREMDGIETEEAKSQQSQSIWMGTWQQLTKVDSSSFALVSSTLGCQSTVNNVGVTIDSQVTMKGHVRRTCIACFYQLRQLRVVRRSLSSDAYASLVRAFISSRLDYCNSLLAGISDTLIRQLQSVLRFAARLGSTIRSPKSSATSFTGCLFDSESTSSWEFWSTSTCTLHNEAPPDLMEMVLPVSHSPGRRMLRSSAHGDVVVPRTESVRLGPRGF